VPAVGQGQGAPSQPLACVFCVNYCHHCLPCSEGIEIGWVIWHVDQVPGRGIEQVKEWYAGFPVKASACVECWVCVERCPFDVEIIAKMHEAAVVFEADAA
jgi:predicted aldo/keto reductase-like oxidoreductase